MSKEDKIVFCTGGGCTAKLGAGVLSRILEKLPRGEKDPDLLVGYDSRDERRNGHLEAYGKEEKALTGKRKNAGRTEKNAGDIGCSGHSGDWLLSARQQRMESEGSRPDDGRVPEISVDGRNRGYDAGCEGRGGRLQSKADAVRRRDE